ncbi:MAG: response regulator [Labilithrix sp.]|nr:response regulator [Labilithrix sp.]
MEDRSFDAARLEVLEAIARGQPLSVVLEQIVRSIEAQSTSMACSILLVSGGRLRHGAAPSLPRGYVEAIDGVEIGPDVGSCGTAAWGGEAVIVEDIATDPRWARYGRVALAHGLCACWSTPIFSPDREVLATFAMYFHAPRRPTAEELAWVDAATHLAAIALGRSRVEAERARLEAQLRQAQKMQSLGTLAGGIAHDFNNVLAAIAGNVSVAKKWLSDGHPAHELLDNVDLARRRATDLVRRILTFSRDEAPRREVIRLQPIVEEALKLLGSSLTSRPEIVLDLAEAGAVLADANQIHQVVMNLATNAAHAGARRLAISLERVDVDAEAARRSASLREGPYVRLSVEDDGSGMDAATVERIFEPFFTTKAPGLGTGLGLAVVDGIVKGHGGALDVESWPGKGTRMSVYLPAVVEELAGAAAGDDEDDQRGHGEHVLYVDDEDALVFVATRTLERLGYRVSGFNSASRALEAFRSRPEVYDVVVTDFAMAEMSGLELTSAIREARPDIPVIVTSGYWRPEQEEAAAALGVRDVVCKPDLALGLGPLLRRRLEER